MLELELDLSCTAGLHRQGIEHPTFHQQQQLLYACYVGNASYSTMQIMPTKHYYGENGAMTLVSQSLNVPTQMTASFQLQSLQADFSEIYVYRIIEVLSLERP